MEYKVQHFFICWLPDGIELHCCICCSLTGCKFCNLYFFLLCLNFCSFVFSVHVKRIFTSRFTVTKCLMFFMVNKQQRKIMNSSTCIVNFCKEYLLSRSYLQKKSNKNSKQWNNSYALPCTNHTDRIVTTIICLFDPLQ